MHWILLSLYGHVGSETSGLEVSDTGALADVVVLCARLAPKPPPLSKHCQSPWNMVDRSTLRTIELKLIW